VFGIGKASFLRKLDLRIAAGFRCLDGFDDSLNIWPKAWPLLQAENPPLLRSCAHVVPFQIPANWYGRRLVE
jgi:hypothetical protein